MENTATPPSTCPGVELVPDNRKGTPGLEGTKIEYLWCAWHTEDPSLSVYPQGALSPKIDVLYGDDQTPNLENLRPPRI